MAVITRAVVYCAALAWSSVMDSRVKSCVGGPIRRFSANPVRTLQHRARLMRRPSAPWHDGLLAISGPSC